jgi:hypothetical protein
MEKDDGNSLILSKLSFEDLKKINQQRAEKDGLKLLRMTI